MSSFLVFVALAVLLLAWLLRRMPQAREGTLPLPVVAAILVTLGAIVVGGFAARPPAAVPPAAMLGPNEPPALPAPPSGEALSPGERAPEIVAAGWVNRPPNGNAGILVIDVWAPWCLVCRDMAPGLVRLHEKYASRGVEFVSLTDMSKRSVNTFVELFEIPWASGYGVPKETIAAFRALRKRVQNPEQQVAPTLYVVDARGRVLWSDDSGRYRHVNVDQLLSTLAEQLDRALASEQ